MLLCLNLPRGSDAPEDPHLSSPQSSSLWKIAPNAAQFLPLHLPLLLPTVTYLGSHFPSGPLQTACVGLFVNNLSRNIRVWGENTEFFTQAARASEAAGAGGMLCLGSLAGAVRPEEEGRRHQESLEPPAGHGRGHCGMAESLEHSWECGQVPLCKVFPSPAEKGMLVCCSSRANYRKQRCFVVVVLFSFSLLIFFFFSGQLSTSLKCFNEEILTAGRSGDEKQS